jgi:uncharacterized protein (DUF2267 family)
MFRGVLHGLRKYMTTAQVISFADALPPLPRGIFIEGWHPGEPQPLTTADVFLRALTENLAPHQIPPDSIVSDVFAILAEHSKPRDTQTCARSGPHHCSRCGRAPEPHAAAVGSSTSRARARPS